MLLKCQRGVGLLELLLAIAIIAVIIVTANRYYQSTSTAQKTNKAVSMIGDIYGAAHDYAKRFDYDPSKLSVAELISANLLSKQFENSPWGGSLTVGKSSKDAKYFDIRMDQIPGAACEEIKSRIELTFSDYEHEAAVCSGSTLTVTYPLY